jgi:regulator of sirC expression with transglutaminase-like and TPR domain
VDFERYCAQNDQELDLLEGALLIARDAYPGLDVAEQMRRVDALAKPLRDRRVAESDLDTQAAALALHLHDECGLRGNVDDYYDPRNSFLNDVLDRALGIPISLSVVYVEVARRAGMSAAGVGFPGHFLMRIEQGGRGVILDPFNGGRILERPVLEVLFRSGTGGRGTLDDSALGATPVRHIVARILMNLRGIYARRGEYARLLVVLDRFMTVVPDAAEELRDRGYLWARLGAPGAAIADLSEYLKRFPHAGDAAEVRRQLGELCPEANDSN